MIKFFAKIDSKKAKIGRETLPTLKESFQTEQDSA